MSKSASDQIVVPEGFGTETSSSTVRGCAALGFGADGGASITTRFERVPMAGLSAGVFAGARALLAGDGRDAMSQIGGARGWQWRTLLILFARGAWSEESVVRGAWSPTPRGARTRDQDENDLF